MAKFTKQHYEEIVELLASAEPIIHGTPQQFPTGYWEDVARHCQWSVTCEKFADRFQKDNPKFNKEKFLKACGLGRN